MSLITKEFMDNYHEGVLDALGRKLPTLLSGRNIKTINNLNILGEGNIDLKSGGEFDSSGRYIVTDENNKRYLINTTELIKPTAPSVSTTSYTIKSGDPINISVTNNTSGSTMEYNTTDGNNWFPIVNNNNINLTPSLGNSSKLEINLGLRASKNGEVSDVRQVTITVYLKVAPGIVSVTRTEGNWSTLATIGLGLSSTSGATTYYSEDSGSTWLELTSSKTITDTESRLAGKYQVKATKGDFVPSDIASSIAFILNARKAYYGFSTSDTLLSASSVKSLIGGGSVNSTTLSGALTINPTGRLAGYVWLCCTGTLQKDKIVPNLGDVVPFGFEDAIVVDGWNCYRSINAIRPESTNVYIP